MMDTTAIQKLLSKLNHDWFKRKSDFFLTEGLYNKEKGKVFDSFEETDYVQVDDDKWEEKERIFTVEIDLKKYCWNSFFYGSMSYGMDSENMPQHFPIDSRDASDEVIEFIKNKIEKFIDIAAIDTVIRKTVEAVKSEVIKLQQSASDGEYTKVLDDFVANTRKEISNEFRHIKEQLKLKKEAELIDRKLTPEICTRIANFRLGNKKLITSVEGEYGEGDALFHLLNPKSEKKAAIKIRIEDWQNQDVYYLLSRLSAILSDRISIADIERKKILFLKKGSLFARNTYDKFRTQTLDTYTAVNPNKPALEAQLQTLFS